MADARHRQAGFAVRAGAMMMRFVDQSQRGKAEARDESEHGQQATDECTCASHADRCSHDRRKSKVRRKVMRCAT